MTGRAIGDPAYLVPHKHGGFLYRVTLHDPVMLRTVTALVLSLALSASAVPAWRASHVDPVLVMRSE